MTLFDKAYVARQFIQQLSHINRLNARENLREVLDNANLPVVIEKHERSDVTFGIHKAVHAPPRHSKDSCDTHLAICPQCDETSV
jgi:hypothetical protein